jgi:hypothetical protein
VGESLLIPPDLNAKTPKASTPSGLLVLALAFDRRIRLNIVSFQVDARLKELLLKNVMQKYVIILTPPNF